MFDGQLQVESLFFLLTNGFGILLICVGVQNLAQFGHQLYEEINSEVVCARQCKTTNHYSNDISVET